MQAAELTYKAGTAVKADPVGSMKVLLFFLLALLLVFVLYKVFTGIKGAFDAAGKVGEKFTDALGTTEQEKREIITTPSYQDNLKWLEQSSMIVPVAQKYKGKSKPADLYLLDKKMTLQNLADAAKKVYTALNMPVYDSADVYNAIAAMPSKAMVSFLATVYNTLYKSTFPYFTMSGMISKRFTVKEMDTLMQIINKKPEL